MKEIWRLFYTFSKVGFFAFGGGYTMLPAIRHETVNVRGWIDEAEISDCIAVCQSLPGAFAVNVAFFIGKRVKGTPGALAAGLGMILPAFLSILLILIFLGQFQENAYIAGALAGIKAASVALILVTVYQMGKGIIRNKTGLLIGAVSFSLIVFLQINAILPIVLSGIAGFLKNRCWKRREGEDA